MRRAAWPASSRLQGAYVFAFISFAFVSARSLFSVTHFTTSSGQFFIEILEAQAETEQTAVFEEESARLFDVFRGCGLDQIDFIRRSFAQIISNRLVLSRIVFAVSPDRHGG